MTRRIFCKLVFVVVGIFGLLVLPSLVSAQGRSEEALEWVKYVQEKHTDALMARPGVVGTAVGLNDDSGYAVLVLLEIPGAPGIPEHLENVPVRPVVTGKLYARVDPTDRFDRPVPTGVSTGHPAITAGTIRCRVIDSSGNVYALSNNHVYADENNGVKGVDPVIQPGTYDGGSMPPDYIGTLADFEPIVFHPRARNKIDAAIASTTVGLVDNSTPSDGYGTPSSVTAEAYIGQAVQKYGRTTGLSHGEVYAINSTVRVGYDSGTARFVEQILIIPGTFSAGGDSGSLIVTDDENCNPVGLLFAGSTSVTVANPIGAVLSRFGVTIDGSEGPPPPPVTDIAITAVSAPSSVVQGNMASVDVTLENVGNQDVTSSINVTLADTTDGVTIATDTISGGLAVGASTTLTYSWDTGGASLGDHTLTASHNFTDDNLANDSKTTTVSVTDAGGGTMHVSAIDMRYSTAGPNYFIYTQVSVVDESGAASDATVYLTTTLPDGSTSSGSGTTGTDGIVTFKLKSRQTGTYTSEVTNVTHISLMYDAGANVETSETLTVP